MKRKLSAKDEDSKKPRNELTQNKFEIFVLVRALESYSLISQFIFFILKNHWNNRNSPANFSKNAKFASEFYEELYFKIRRRMLAKMQNSPANFQKLGFFRRTSCR